VGHGRMGWTGTWEKLSKRLIDSTDPVKQETQ
jgi:hypothetical protein